MKKTKKSVMGWAGLITIIIGFIFFFNGCGKSDDTPTLIAVLFFLLASIFIVIWFKIDDKEVDEAHEKRNNKLAKQYGYSSYDATVGNDVFSIDKYKNLWLANYTHNMETYMCMGQISNILGYSIEPVYAEQSNSVGRAITGGILFGSTGAIIGALTASSRIVQTSNCYLTISTNISYYGTQQYQIPTSIGKDIVRTLDYLKNNSNVVFEKQTNYKNIDSENEVKETNTVIGDIEEPASQSEGTDDNTESSIRIIEIKALMKLYEQKIITKDEFKARRKDIIDKF